MHHDLTWRSVAAIARAAARGIPGHVLRASAVLSVVALGGCTLQFALDSDPGGLPCSAEGLCRQGYACVDTDGIKRCVAAAKKQAGDACFLGTNGEDVECADGLVCRNAYDGDCENGAPAVNCETARAAGASQLVCRVQCNPNEPAETSCGLGERCMVDASNQGQGYCQQGACSVNSNCGQNGAQSNVCASATNGDNSGICLYGCNPFDCNPAAGCSGCGAPALGWDSCEPYDAANGLFACFPRGNVPAGQPCDGQNAVCAPGAFCNTGGGQGYCAKYCNVAGGSPACNAGVQCVPTAPGSTVGFCAS